SLIERTTRRFELTAVGRDYFKRARELLDALERLDADPAGVTSRVEVSVAAPHDVLVHVVAPVLGAYRERHAQVTLRLAGEGWAAGLPIAAASKAEAGDPIVGTFDRVLCAPPGYLSRGRPSSPADLSTHVGILVGDVSEGWALAGGASRRPGEAVHAADA